MAKTPPTDDHDDERVVALFRDADLPEAQLDVSHMPGVRPAAPVRSGQTATAAVDLTGKTTLLR